MDSYNPCFILLASFSEIFFSLEDLGLIKKKKKLSYYTYYYLSSDTIHI